MIRGRACYYHRRGGEGVVDVFGGDDFEIFKCCVLRERHVDE